MSDAIVSLQHGEKYPLDAPDAWWKGPAGQAPPLAKDWAHLAARGVIADLQDRGGIKQQLTQEIDEDTRVEIINSLAEIIREAKNYCRRSVV